MFFRLSLFARRDVTLASQRVGYLKAAQNKDFVFMVYWRGLNAQTDPSGHSMSMWNCRTD
jgi:hypothetical protein